MPPLSPSAQTSFKRWLSSLDRGIGRNSLAGLDRAARRFQNDNHDEKGRFAVAAGGDSKWGEADNPVPMSRVLTPDDHTRMKEAWIDADAEGHGLTAESIPISSLTTVQDIVWLGQDGLPQSKTDLPVSVVRHKGETIIMNGNHRVAAALAKGATHILVKAANLR